MLNKRILTISFLHLETERYTTTTYCDCIYLKTDNGYHSEKYTGNKKRAICNFHPNRFF